MEKAPYNLLLVAHPDDESLFFAGLVMRRRNLPWHLICATDGNADGRGQERASELKRAAKILGIRNLEHWRYRDIYSQRLPAEVIAMRLQALPTPNEVFTHNPLGEYGHPHHQDLCAAAHYAFPAKKIFSPAYNCEADFAITLKKTELLTKKKLYAKIYAKEAARFIEQLPLSTVENFAQFSRKEALAMHNFFIGGELPSASDLQKFRWMRAHLNGIRERISRRPF